MQAVNHHNTTHTEHKAFQRPFVSLLNLTIVPPRQSTDKVWMDLLRQPDGEAMPCIFTVNVVLMSKVQCVCPQLQKLALPTETAHYLMFNRMVTAPYPAIQSVKGKV